MAAPPDAFHSLEKEILIKETKTYFKKGGDVREGPRGNQRGRLRRCFSLIKKLPPSLSSRVLSGSGTSGIFKGKYGGNVVEF